MENRKTIISFQGLRWLAILLIFISHCNLFVNNLGNNILMYCGGIGVSLFICLSGYLAMNKKLSAKAVYLPNSESEIINDNSKSSKVKNYFSNVFKSIKKYYGLHIITLLVAIPLSLSVFKENILYGFGELLINALLLQSFVPIQSVYFSFNAVSWYLSLTMFFVIVSPLITFIIEKFKTIPCVVSVVFIIAVEYVLGFFLNGISIAHWAVYIFPVTRLLDYILGCIICKAVIKIKLNGGGENFKASLVSAVICCVSIAMIIALIVLSALFPHEIFSVAVWNIPVILMIFALSLGEECSKFIKIIFKNKLFVYLGGISFEIFLFHQLIIRYSEAVFLRLGLNIKIVIYLFAFLVTLGVCALYSYIVKRIKNRSREKTNTGNNKLKLFLNNFLIYGIGGTISKIIPLIMIPIVTRLMPNTEYFGISDMLNTILSFASALAIMGMYDAMYRMFFEKEDEKYKKEICSTAFVFTIGTSLFVFALLLVLKDYLAEWFLNDRELSNLIYITAIATLVGATNSIVSAPTRMQNKRLVYVVMNTVSPIVSYAISIPLLLTGHYLIALPLAGMISAILSEIVFLILNRKWFSFKLIKPKYILPLLTLALPLLPNFVIYWIFDSCDKLMITNMIGVGAEGVYSVGAKFGHMSQLIYTAFAGGWQFFAFSIMKEQNQVKTNSRIFEYLGIISFCCSMFVFALSEPVFKLLFEEDYQQAFIIAPYLFLAPLLLMLFQVADNQLLVIKKTWPNILILSVGAGLNILLNFFLIPILGIEGAAIATLSGYVLSLIICVIVLYIMKLIKLDLRFYIAAGLMIAYVLIWRLLTLNIIWLNVIMAVAISAVMILLYLKDIKVLVNGFKVKKQNTVEEQSTLTEQNVNPKEANLNNENSQDESYEEEGLNNES